MQPCGLVGYMKDWIPLLLTPPPTKGGGSPGELCAEKSRT